MKITIRLAQILAALAPVFATIAATLATWLVVHVHLLALFHIGASGIAAAIAQGLVWGTTALGTYLIQHKILSGIIDLVKLEHAHSLAMQGATSTGTQVPPAGQRPVRS